VDNYNKTQEEKVSIYIYIYNLLEGTFGYRCKFPSFYETRNFIARFCSFSPKSSPYLRQTLSSKPIFISLSHLCL